MMLLQLQLIASTFMKNLVRLILLLRSSLNIKYLPLFFLFFVTHRSTSFWHDKSIPMNSLSDQYLQPHWINPHQSLQNFHQMHVHLTNPRE